MAAELAGWQDLHEKMGRKAIKDLAKSMLIKERTALEGIKRAIRKLKVVPVVQFRPSMTEGLVLEAEANNGNLIDADEGVVEEVSV